MATIEGLQQAASDLTGRGDAAAMVTRMVKASQEIGAITKDRKAPTVIGGFSFRGIDDVYAAVHPVLIANSIVILPSVEHCERTKLEKNDLVTVRVAYQIIMPEGTLHPVVVGEGMDKADKAANKAMSSAYKNMIFQTFCVPSEGQAVDPEADAHEEKKEAPEKREAPTLSSSATHFGRNEREVLWSKAWKRCGEIGIDDKDDLKAEALELCKEFVASREFEKMDMIPIGDWKLVDPFVAQWFPKKSRDVDFSENVQAKPDEIITERQRSGLFALANENLPGEGWDPHTLVHAAIGVMGLYEEIPSSKLIPKAHLTKLRETIKAYAFPVVPPSSMVEKSAADMDSIKEESQA